MAAATKHATKKATSKKAAATRATTAPAPEPEPVEVGNEASPAWNWNGNGTRELTDEQRTAFAGNLRMHRIRAGIGSSRAFAEAAAAYLPAGLDFGDSQIRNYETGRSVPRHPWQLAAIEQVVMDALEEAGRGGTLQPGFLSKHLGWPAVSASDIGAEYQPVSALKSTRRVGAGTMTGGELAAIHAALSAVQTTLGVIEGRLGEFGDRIYRLESQQDEKPRPSAPRRQPTAQPAPRRR